MNEYPPNWPAIATARKNAANWKCQRCGHAHDPRAGYTLTVHHLDGDKANCAWWNLPVLCQRCHLKIQGKVQMDQGFLLEHSEWMRPFVEGRKAALECRP